MSVTFLKLGARVFYQAATFQAQVEIELTLPRPWKQGIFL